MTEKQITRSVLTLDEPTSSRGIIFPKEELQTAIIKFKERDRSTSFGTLRGSYYSAELSFNEVSHEVNDIWIEDNRVLASVTILNTPKGKLVSELLDAKISIGFQPAGYGFVNKDKTITDFTLERVDVDVDVKPIIGNPFMEMINTALGVTEQSDIDAFDKAKRALLIEG